MIEDCMIPLMQKAFSIIVNPNEPNRNMSDKMSDFERLKLNYVNELVL